MGQKKEGDKSHLGSALPGDCLCPGQNSHEVNEVPASGPKETDQYIQWTGAGVCACV